MIHWQHPHLQTGQLGSWPVGAMVSNLLSEQRICREMHTLCDWRDADS